MITFYLRDKTSREEDVYTIDWTPHIGEDTLTATEPVVEVLDGSVTVTRAENDPDAGETNFWIEGGSNGEVPRIAVGIDTVGLRKLDAHLLFGVRF
jgi:hypothetical protein